MKKSLKYREVICDARRVVVKIGSRVLVQRTGRPDVLATVYQGEGRSIVALASWATDTARVRLAVDWTRLGLDPANARIVAPELPGYQPAASFGPYDPIPVAPGRGWLLLFETTLANPGSGDTHSTGMNR